MDANRHIRVTTLRYQIDSQGTEQFWTKNKQEDTVNSQLRFQINRKIYLIRSKYFGCQTP